MIIISSSSSSAGFGYPMVAPNGLYAAYPQMYTPTYGYTDAVAMYQYYGGATTPQNVYVNGNDPTLAATVAGVKRCDAL